MAKAVLVMDMPKDCCDCQFCRELDEGVKACCEIMDSPSNSELCRVIDVHYCMEKPEWCPLRPVPEKKEVIGKYPQADHRPPSYKVGWNDCIDKILGGM